MNYASNSPENAGLLNLAAQVEKDGNTLVLDGGDAPPGNAADPILPGAPGEWPIHPVAAAFNAMGLDYFTLGNHDFNFGYEALREYLEAMDGVCLCTNVEDLGGQLRIRPWAVHTLDNGLRIGITGVCHGFREHLGAAAESGADSDHRRLPGGPGGLRRTPRPGATCAYVSYHGGFEEDLATGQLLFRQRGEYCL